MLFQVATYPEGEKKVGLHIHYPVLHDKENVNYLTACSHFLLVGKYRVLAAITSPIGTGVLHICYQHGIHLV